MDLSHCQTFSTSRPRSRSSSGGIGRYQALSVLIYSFLLLQGLSKLTSCKWETPTGLDPTWSKRHISYDIRGLVSSPDELVDALKRPSALSVLSARSPEPPRTTTEYTQVELTNDGHTAVPYNYDSWTKSACSSLARDSVDGILTPRQAAAKGGCGTGRGSGSGRRLCTCR